MNEEELSRFKERFEKKEHCISLAIDYVYFFLRKSYLPYEKVKKCRTLIDLYKIFVTSGFLVRCQCHPVFLKNPIILYIKYKSYCLTKNLSHPSIFAIITYSSAYEMYGINDFWKHCVVETVNYEEYNLYDSYYDYIFDEYNGLVVNRLTHNNLQNIKKISLMIWEG